MPRIAVEGSSRTSLRIRTKENALLMSAAALSHTGLTDFVLDHALRAAKAAENPLAPTAKLTAAARALPMRS
jgi:uncharacterized protein (DUF1778 family)